MVSDTAIHDTVRLPIVALAVWRAREEDRGHCTKQSRP